MLGILLCLSKRQIEPISRAFMMVHSLIVFLFHMFMPRHEVLHAILFVVRA